MGKESRLKAVDPPKPAEPVALPTMLEPAEIAYTQTMFARIQRELAEHEALKKCWIDFLTPKYQLGPRDRIDLSGRITREPEKESA